MITFFEIGRKGRLGNQFFQYAALRAASLKSGFESKIPNLSNATWHGQQCLLDSFNIESPILQADEAQYIRHFLQQDVSSCHYSSILDSIRDNTNISGHFIHLDYFQDFKDEIFSELRAKSKLEEKEQQFLNDLREEGHELVSLHIRRGDNTDGTNPEISKHYGEDPLDTRSELGKFVTNSINFFSNRKVKFIVFVGGSRTGNDETDLEWAKKHFTDESFVISDTNDAVSDFVRMYSCDHNIISFSSTYSLWAGYLNKNENKSVICPENFWLSRPIEWDREKIFMDSWNII